MDAYCGSGLFAISAANGFIRLAGVEISPTSVAFARENAAANADNQRRLLAGQAEAIFQGLEFPAAETVVVIDPPGRVATTDFYSSYLPSGRWPWSMSAATPEPKCGIWGIFSKLDIAPP